MKTKTILLLFFLIFSFNANSMFILSSAYWSGCVQGSVELKGQSKGEHSKKCAELTKIKFENYDFSKFKESRVIKESKEYFLSGCKKSGLSENNCQRLTNKYHNDIKEILSQ